MNFPCENYLRFTFNFFSYLFLHFLLGTFPFTFLHFRPTIMIISPAGKMMAELVMPIIAFNFMIFVHCCACLSWLHGKMPSHFLTGISCGILPISFLPGFCLYIIAYSVTVSYFLICRVFVSATGDNIKSRL